MFWLNGETVRPFHDGTSIQASNLSFVGRLISRSPIQAKYLRHQISFRLEEIEKHSSSASFSRAFLLQPRVQFLINTRIAAVTHGQRLRNQFIACITD